MNAEKNDPTIENISQEGAANWVRELSVQPSLAQYSIPTHAIRLTAHTVREALWRYRGLLEQDRMRELRALQERHEKRITELQEKLKKLPTGGGSSPRRPRGTPKIAGPRVPQS